MADILMFSKQLRMIFGLVVAATVCQQSVSAQAQPAHEQLIRETIAERVRESARAFERDWQTLSERVRLLESRNDRAGLACLLLEQDCANLRADVAPLMADLRVYAKRDPPCGTVGGPCAPADFDRPYVNCILGNFGGAIAVKTKDLRARAAAIATMRDLREITRIMGDALSTIKVQGVDIGEDGIKSCAPAIRLIEPRVVDSIDVNVKWGAQCTVEDKILDDGSAELYHPSVAALLHEDAVSGERAFCTGTLIAPNAVLTAAHCFCETGARGDRGSPFYPTYASCRNGAFYARGRAMSPLDTERLSIFLQHAGTFEAEQVILNQDFRWTDRLPRADLAIVLLKQSVSGIEPAAIDTIRSLRFAPTGITVGFGYANRIDASGQAVSSSTIVEKTGIKLEARIALSPCLSAERRRKLICWDRRDQPGGQRFGSTCNGDSGGPLFMDVGGKTYLTGVTSAGSPGCGLGTRAYDMEVFHFRRWISRVVRAFPPPPPEVDRRNPRQVRCRYFPMTGKGSQTLEIPAGRASRLHVSLNCTPIGLPIALSLKKAGAASSACEKSSVATALSCDVAARPRESWSIDYEGPAAAGCQLVATTFE